ncbi:hypothetical protein PVAP13_6KG233712 [Panicum virgatum]|uniref:Uncharacterized protein n=1 Tax=Panicum virgatum TaxID=38727 RepID=A0A8T0RCL0_PANVG|nr:hypothetical protein PVAP13_6KG233712 [Panicum virgatum]
MAWQRTARGACGAAASGGPRSGAPSCRAPGEQLRRGRACAAAGEQAERARPSPCCGRQRGRHLLSTAGAALPCRGRERSGGAERQWRRWRSRGGAAAAAVELPHGGRSARRRPCGRQRASSLVLVPLPRLEPAARLLPPPSLLRARPDPVWAMRAALEARALRWRPWRGGGRRGLRQRSAHAGGGREEPAAGRWSPDRRPRFFLLTWHNVVPSFSA